MTEYTREDIFSRLEQKHKNKFDIVVIGGGATGIGCAWAACSRGHDVLVAEKYDFAKGTSSRSTKLIHGGVRYLAQGNVELVKESLQERQKLLSSFPHLVKWKKFLVPGYKPFESVYYRTGLALYDLLGRVKKAFRSGFYSKKTSLSEFPNLNPDGLKSSAYYRDAQFDDSRLVIDMVRKIWSAGSMAINYLSLKSIVKLPAGDYKYQLTLWDEIAEKEIKVRTKILVNAAGIFSHSVVKLFNPDAENPLVLSKGVHFVVNKSFAKTENALLIPKTRDGRVLFVVPWKDKVLVGTTDSLQDQAEIEPSVKPEEIDYLLDISERYLHIAPSKEDILSVFAGLRALVKPKTGSQQTKEISRKHQLTDHKNGILTILGGKWTTFRKIGEDSIRYMQENKWIVTKPQTYFLEPGNLNSIQGYEVLDIYGPLKSSLIELIEKNVDMGEQIIPSQKYLRVQVYWAVKEEFALNLEDVLARRLRILFLDVEESLKMAKPVVGQMAQLLQKDKEWENQQLASFTELSKQYFPDFLNNSGATT